MAILRRLDEEFCGPFSCGRGMHELIGRTLAHYRVVRMLGSGAMGEVYLAQDTVLGRSVALKVLPSETSVIPDRMRRFVEEAKAASALNHPNIATIHELREADGIDKHAIATALVNRGEVARRMGDYAAAQSLIDEGLALAKDMGDKAVIPMALNSLGDLVARQGDYVAARALYTEGLEVSRALGDRRLIAEMLQSLGVVAEEYPAARSLFEESLAIRRELGDRAEIAMTLNCLGRVTARQGDYAAACSLHEEGLAICQQSGAKDGIAQSLKGLADVARLRGDHAAALSLYKQSLAILWESGEKPELLQPLEHVAAVVMARGLHDRAVRLWGAAQAFRNVISVPRPPYETDDYERQISAARAALGEEGFAAVWAEGQAMGADQAIAYALQDVETWPGEATMTSDPSQK